ncbi:MAG: hypothetical protein ACI8W1_000624, partial [Candidatus Azotimanducaceae bacterium]
MRYLLPTVITFTSAYAGDVRLSFAHQMNAKSQD